jgi:hypothetical protein
LDNEFFAQYSIMKFRNDSTNINAIDPFANDALERKPTVEFVEGVITKAEGPLVLALDSPWGTGKTTFVKMLQVQLEKKMIHCLYFNAWSVDYATDPLAALVSKISFLNKNDDPTLTSRMKKLKSIATLVGKRGLIAAAKAMTLGGLDLEKEYEAILAQGNSEITSDLFDSITKEAELLAKFKEELQEFVQDLQVKGSPSNLVFFIDELDRCRPNFAIELLERIKHLFDVPNIIFVLSIDKSQLEVSTSAIYGTGINAREYLRRFIDLEFRLPQVSGKLFINHLVKRFGLDVVFSKRQPAVNVDLPEFINTFELISKATGMSLRTQEQSIGRFALLMEQIPPNYNLYPYLAATLISARAIKPELYREIQSGSAFTQELMNWIFLNDKNGMIKRNTTSAVIAASLLESDENTERRDKYIKYLETESSNESLKDPEKSYAINTLKFYNGSKYDKPNLNYLLKKIDLVQNLK